MFVLLCLIWHRTKLKITFVSFIQAIRRLTADDEQLIKKICEIMNKVFCKGKDMEKMMEDLKDFRKLTAEQEELLKEYKGINYS